MFPGEESFAFHHQILFHVQEEEDDEEDEERMVYSLLGCSLSWWTRAVRGR